MNLYSSQMKLIFPDFVLEKKYGRELNLNAL